MEKMGLKDLRERTWAAYETCATTGDGLYEVCLSSITFLSLFPSLSQLSLFLILIFFSRHLIGSQEQHREKW